MQIINKSVGKLLATVGQTNDKITDKTTENEFKIFLLFKKNIENSKSEANKVNKNSRE